MTKLILEMQLSVDGFMAGPEGQTDWMVWNWGPEWTWDKELQAFHTGLTKTAGHILISRQMAEEGFIAHWRETASRNDEQAAFAKHIAGTPKTIISTTLSMDKGIPGGWDNVSIAKQLLPALNMLKKEVKGNIMVYGGAKLVSSLLEQGLIDELYLLINPIAIARGLSVFTGPQDFHLKEAKGFSPGITMLHYSV